MGSRLNVLFAKQLKGKWKRLYMAWPVDKVEVSVQRKCTLLKEKEKKGKELYLSV